MFAIYFIYDVIHIKLKEKPMKTKLLFLVSSLAFAGFAHAQNTPTSGVVVSTDPAKIADIERRAQQLGATMRVAAPVPGRPMMTEEHRAMHERMQNPDYKQGYQHGYKQGSIDHAGVKDGKDAHGHAMHHRPHGDKRMHRKGPHGGKHMEGKGPHGDKHPMMDGKGPHGAKPAMPADAPAKP
jgi:hypothetical protein